MASDSELTAKCEEIREKYSPCDVSDALLTLKVPFGGTLADIAPVPIQGPPGERLVASISTVLFVAKEHQPGDDVSGLLIPKESNLPSDKHFTDVAPPGSAVLMQQPPDQIAALLGDIVATRYLVRRIQGVFVDGRSRDVVGIGELSRGSRFQAWTRSLSSTGTSADAKPWAVDVPLKVGKMIVRPGDIICADQAEKVACVIPCEKLDQVLALLPMQKKADDGLLKDVQDGMDFKAAVKRHPDHYTLHQH